MDIKKALATLLTSDGKGRERKSKVLMEMLETCHSSTVREEVEKFLKENK